MKASIYLIALGWGVAISALTWFILTAVPKQAIQSTGPDIRHETTKNDTTIQLLDGPLITKQDLASNTADTTSLPKKPTMELAHTWAKNRIDSLNTTTIWGKRTSEYANAMIVRRRPQWGSAVESIRKPYWRVDSLVSPSVDTTKPAPTVLPPGLPPVVSQKQYVRDGQLAFNWPSQMNINSTYQIHLVISWDTTRRQLTSAVATLVNSDPDTTGQRRKEEFKSIEIGKQMRAILTGASPTDTSVSIMPLGDPEQTIDFSSGHTASWSWNVTPRRSGRLVLSVYFERETPLPPVYVYSKAIAVQGVDPGMWAKVFTVLADLNKLWTVISTGAIGTIATASYQYYQKRRTARQTPGQSAGN